MMFMAQPAAVVFFGKVINGCGFISLFERGTVIVCGLHVQDSKYTIKPGVKLPYWYKGYGVQVGRTY